MSPCRLLERRYEHPWLEEPGWVTEHYACDTHNIAEKEAVEKTKQGWSIWLVSNTGFPGFVIFKKVE